MDEIVHPKRRFSLKLNVGGDTREEMIALLNYFVTQIEGGSTDFVSGGCASGGHFNLIEDADMTPELYRVKLKEYLEEKRNQRWYWPPKMCPVIEHG